MPDAGPDMAVEMDIMRVALDERDQRIATLAAEIIIMRQLEAEVLKLRAANVELQGLLHGVLNGDAEAEHTARAKLYRNHWFSP
jgi:Pyruvate/2-oxoacid:ferredoxin oxidoreductase gamma subunit